MRIILKYGLLILLFCNLPGKVFSAKKEKETPPNICSNYIVVQGSSNINHFEFNNDNITVNTPPAPSSKSLKKQTIRIPIQDFDGSNKIMLKDFFKLLKASEYPFINIYIDSDTLLDFSKNIRNAELNTTIALAGTSKKYEIPCSISYCDKDSILITGLIQIKLSDFSIPPPKKALGTIRVKDEVFITFAFKPAFRNS